MTQKKKILPDSSLTERVTLSIGELRKTFRLVAQNYEQRIDKELSEILALLETGRNTKSRIATLRDMLALIRNLQVRPEKGRRKDLRKIDSLVGDLSMLVEDLKKAPPRANRTTAAKPAKTANGTNARKTDPPTRPAKRTKASQP